MPSPVERGFIPLKRIEKEQPSDIVTISLGMPSFVNKDRIGVNLGRMEGLAKLSGIKRIQIKDSSGDQSLPVELQVAGFNPDGSAMASRSGLQTMVPAYEYKPQILDSGIPMNQRVINLNISVNLDAIGSQLASSREAVRSPRGWARELDRGTRELIRRAGRANLMGNVSDEVTTTYAVITTASGLTTLSVLTEFSISSPPMLFGELWLLLYMMFQMADLAKGHKKENYRNSIFLGPQLDRAAALNLLTRSQKLIKEITPSGSKPTSS